MRKFVWRFWDERPFATTPAMVLRTPFVVLIVVIGDLGKMLGYPQGRWERFRLGGPDGLEAAKIRSHRSMDELGELDKRLPKEQEVAESST